MIRNAKLKSGLELVHYPIKQTRFVEIALAVGVGSRFEPKEWMGISHFTEHILFRGCKAFPGTYALNHAFDHIGEGLNAMTHKEFTLYTTKVPVEFLPKALKWLAAVLSEPLFADIETEKKIILEEILEEIDEAGDDTDLENVSRRYIFGDHPLGGPILGRLKNLKRINEKELRAFHRAYYVPSNMVLAVAGPCGWEATLDAATHAFGKNFRPRGSSKDVIEFAPTEAPELKINDLRPGVHFVPHDASQVEVIFSFFMEGERDPGELSRIFISRVLDDGISSRLQRTVCERRGLVYDISCGIESFTDVSLFDVQFNVSPKNLLEVVEVVIGQLSRLKTERMREYEFDHVQDRFRRDVLATAESARGMAHLLAEAFLLRLPMPLEPKEYEARIDEITPASVQKEAQAGFHYSRLAFYAKGKVPKSLQKQIQSRLVNI